MEDRADVRGAPARRRRQHALTPCPGDIIGAHHTIWAEHRCWASPRARLRSSTADAWRTRRCSRSAARRRAAEGDRRRRARRRLGCRRLHAAGRDVGADHRGRRAPPSGSSSGWPRRSSPACAPRWARRTSPRPWACASRGRASGWPPSFDDELARRDGAALARHRLPRRRPGGRATRRSRRPCTPGCSGCRRRSSSAGAAARPLQPCSRRRRTECAGETSAAIQAAYQGDFTALDAYLVESAVAAGDDALLTVTIRWDLAVQAVSELAGAAGRLLRGDRRDPRCHRRRHRRGGRPSPAWTSLVPA